MSIATEQRRLKVAIPRQRLKAGDIGHVLTEYPISKSLSMRFRDRYVTVRSDQVEAIPETPE